MKELFSKIIEEIENNRRVALITVVNKLGSAPREPGAKMLVFEDGTTLGTIGGGSFERQVVSEALKAIREEKPRKIKYVFRRDHIPKDAVPTGLECGGELEVFIDVISPAPRIIIVGAGHIGKPLADLAHMMSFRVIVIDENSEIASRERFPYAEKIIVNELAKGLLEAEVSRNDFVAIVYGGLEEDYKVFKQAILAEPRYVGLLGSKRKVTLFKKQLLEEGINLDNYKGRVYAPIGLDIGARTPEEIAVSIMAEITSIIRGAKNVKHLSII